MSIVVEFTVPPGKPVLRGIDHFWSVIRTLNERGAWSIHDVLLRTNGTDRSTVADFVNRLVAAGFAESTGETIKVQRRPASLFRLLKAPVRTPALRRDGTTAFQGRGQTAMWNVMRGPLARNGFSYRELVLYGTTDDVEVKPETAKAYIKRLGEAGYLVCLREGRPRHPGQWRLKPAMNTGPLAPLILRTHVVFDQNRKEAFGPSLGEEVAP